MRYMVFLERRISKNILTPNAFIVREKPIKPPMVLASANPLTPIGEIRERANTI